MDGRRLVAYALLVLCITAAAGSSERQPWEFLEHYYIPGQMMIWIKDASLDQVDADALLRGELRTGLASLDTLMARTGVLSTETSWVGLRRKPRICLLHFTEDIDFAAMVAMAALYAQNEHVRLAEPAYYSPVVSNDTYYNSQWAHDAAHMDSPNAWSVVTGSPAVTIALIDTGMDMDHPDLVGSLWVNPGEIPGNEEDDDGNGLRDDINGWDFVGNDNNPSHGPGDTVCHGTKMAGVIAAETNNGVGVAGVAGGWAPVQTGCRIMVLKAGADSLMYPSHIESAIEYAIDNGAKVINCSFAPLGSFVRDLLLQANSSAILCVVAGGRYTAQQGNMLTTLAPQ